MPRRFRAPGGHRRRTQALVDAAKKKGKTAAAEERASRPTDGPRVVTLGSHDAPASALIVGPDNRFVATAALDGTIRIFDAASGNEVLAQSLAAADAIRLRVGHTMADDSPLAQPLALALAASGEWLAIGGTDGAIHRLDLISGHWLRPWLGANGAVTALAVDADPNALLSVDSMGTVAVWEAATGVISRWLSPPCSGENELPPLAFDAATKTAFTIAKMSPGVRGVVAWNLTTAACRAILPVEFGTAVAFDRTSNRLIVAGGKLVVISLNEGTQVEFGFSQMAMMPPMARREFFTCVAVSHEGRFLAVGCRDGAVRVWALDRPHEPVATVAVQPLGSAVGAVEWFADGRFATVGADGSLRLIV